MARRLDAVKDARSQKLQKLRALGINPYPAKYEEKTHTISEARKMEGEIVGVAGRIWGRRKHGGTVFADLKDESGQIQIWFKKEKLGEDFQTLALLDIGDFLGVKGELVETKAGEVTIDVSSFTILAKSLRPLPSTWHGLKDVEERYRRRYVDLLLNPQVRENLLVRSKFIKLLREYLDKNGFLEIETPVLQPIYGGASARPFTTHHNALDNDFYLRISDELYLKRLIVGGFEKIYEIGKDFRNEGLERGRNPEFTQLEFYWAYVDYEDLMKFTEEMVSSIIKEIKGSFKIEYEGKELDFTPPWKRVRYRDLILSETGMDIDKINTEEELLTKIKKAGVSLDLHGVVGYGALLDAFYKRAVRPKIIGPIFLIDRPVELVPLAKRKEGDPRKVATFQLLAVGEEFLNAYNELNDPQDQRRRWEDENRLAQKGFEEYQVLDEDYIRALEYGMPPTAGWGLGIDRFLMLLTGAVNIKEVMAFPTLRPENLKKQENKGQ